MIRILKTDNYQTMPWKNGKGSTLEIARSHGQGLEDFDWRVSIADVNSAGTFSFFAGKKRIIGVLEGSGLILSIDKKKPITLKQKEFFAFHGESEVHAELINDPIKDFNVIYNPNKYTVRFQWQNALANSPWISEANYILIFNIMDKLKIKVSDHIYELNYFESLLIENKEQALQITPETLNSYNFGMIELFMK